MKISKYLFIFSILLVVFCSVACNNEKKNIGEKKVKKYIPSKIVN